MATGNTGRNMRRMYKELLGEAAEYLGEDAGDDTLSQFWEYPLQAHHCISCSVINNNWNGVLARKAEDAGYDINTKSNGIALPAWFGHQMLNKEQRHRGGHSKTYYQKVKKRLEPIYKKFKDKDCCDDNKPHKQNILGELKAAESDIKGKIESKTWWLYDWSKKLYNGDYRDEGHGSLRSDRNREGSAAAGDQWLKNYGGNAVKRRYKEVAGEKTIRTNWYTKYGYPVPGRLTS